ncbi:MAG: hypothetical protein H7Z37_16550, partial [Pyrinomonadaceae bacterium]|nr:hypothetical protein [Pyrinomonadaceae bacterium]
MKNALEKRKEKVGKDAELAPAFGFAVLGVMAMVFAMMQIPMTIIIFLVLVGYFVWRAVVRTEIGEVRGIFEFYLAANEILRDDERRWFGFEINDVTMRGERILAMMPDAPPLVHFALGALYHHAGNFNAADVHLAYLTENQTYDERNFKSASAELRSYVRILRKLEREPSEAPQTMAAIRALERARRHRAAVLLTESREKIQIALSAAPAKELNEGKPHKEKPQPLRPLFDKFGESPKTKNEDEKGENQANGANINGIQTETKDDPKKRKPRLQKENQPQKPISDVL